MREENNNRLRHEVHADENFSDDEENVAPEKSDPSDVLALYLRDIGKIKMFASREEEMKAAKKVARRRKLFHEVLFSFLPVARQITQDFTEIVDSGNETTLERYLELRKDTPKDPIFLHMSENARTLTKLLQEMPSFAGERKTKGNIAKQKLQRMRTNEKIRTLLGEFPIRTSVTEAYMNEVGDDVQNIDAPTNGKKKSYKELEKKYDAKPQHLTHQYAVLLAAHARFIKDRNHFMEANLRLTIPIAKHFRGNGLSFEDLIQDGNVGMLRAIDRFDTGLGYKFSTTATHWTKQGITRSLQNSSILPVNLFDNVRKMRKMRQQLEASNIEPTPKILAENMGVSVVKIEDWLVQEKKHFTKNLEDPVPGESFGDEPPQILSILQAPEQDQDKGFLKNETIEKIEKMMRTLMPREREVLDLYFGLTSGSSLTLDEVGKKMGGITRERVRQIKAKAIEKIRSTDRRLIFESDEEEDISSVI